MLFTILKWSEAKLGDIYFSSDQFMFPVLCKAPNRRMAMLDTILLIGKNV